MNTDRSPVVSILIPMYKVEPFIGRCLSSVLSQDYRPLQIVLCDDASPDKSLDYAKDALSSLGDGISLTILKNDRNRGSAFTRKRLVENATGEYLLWIDADDYWDSSTNISFLISEMEQSGTDVLVTDYYADYPGKTIYIPVDCPLTGRDAGIAILSGRMPGFLCNKCFRASSFNAFAGSFTEGCNRLEDVQVLVPLFARGVKIKYLPFAFLHYVQYNSNSQMKTVSIGNVSEVMDAIDKCKRQLSELGLLHEYREAIDMGYLQMKAVLLLNISFPSYSIVRAVHPEVDALNRTRPSPWYLKLIYALQIQRGTALVGFIFARLLSLLKCLSRR